MTEESKSMMHRRAQRLERRERLPSMLQELTVSNRRWKEFVEIRLNSDARPSVSNSISINHRLLLRPSYPEAALRRERGRPPADARRSSVLGRLAHGSDPFALRLYLTMLAVHHLAMERGVPEVFADIQAIEKQSRSDKRKSAYGVTWATLSVVGVTDHAKRRSKMSRALRKLSTEGLISTSWAPSGLGRGICLEPLKLEDRVSPPEATADVGMPLNFFTNGWSSLLTGNEILDLMMLQALPKQTVYEEIIPDPWPSSTLTTKRPPKGELELVMHPNEEGERIHAIRVGERLLRPTQVKGAVAARTIREEVFGIYEAAYVVINDLCEMGLVKTVAPAITPDTTDPDRSRRASGSTAAFSVDCNRMELKASDVIDEVLSTNTEPWTHPWSWHPNVRQVMDRRRLLDLQAWPGVPVMDGRTN